MSDRALFRLLRIYGQIDLHIVSLALIFQLVEVLVLALFFRNRLLLDACNYIVLDYVEAVSLLHS